MRSMIVAVLASGAAFGALATTAARAMPVAPPAAPAPYVDVQANRVCDAEGWCWFLPYYLPYGYYGYRNRYDLDEPRSSPYRRPAYYGHPHDWSGHDWSGHGDRQRRREDDDER